MAKNHSKSSTPPVKNSLPRDTFADMDQIDVWDIQDPNDQAFWEEFFRIEDMLSVTDELDPPSFSITVQNHQTGEAKTYQNIHLRPARKKVVC
jgi:hypothetical protein